MLRQSTFGSAQAWVKALSLLLGLALAASVAIGPAFALDKRRSFSKSDDNDDTTIRLGDIIAVWLPVRTETGATWKVVALPETLERNGARVVGGVDDSPGAVGRDRFGIGGGGDWLGVGAGQKWLGLGGEERPAPPEMQVFWFRAKKKGIGKLYLAKGKPSEFTQPPLDTFLLKITVD
jgi:hypothetical protein